MQITIQKYSNKLMIKINIFNGHLHRFDVLLIMPKLWMTTIELTAILQVFKRVWSSIIWHKELTLQIEILCIHLKHI